MVVNNARRYRGLKARSAYRGGKIPIAVAYREKQAHTPGVLLPDDFPYLNKLGSSPAMLYTCYEDLQGVTLIELRELSLNDREIGIVTERIKAYFEGS